MSAIDGVLGSLAMACIPAIAESPNTLAGIQITFCPFCGQRLKSPYFVTLNIQKPLPHGDTIDAKT